MGRINDYYVNQEMKMIRTKDLVEFMRKENMIPAHKFNDEDVEKIEYREEIIKRLGAYDKLKESIEELHAQMFKT